MEKEEPKTPANTGTSQTNVPTPQTQAPGVQQDCQSGKQSPTDGEAKSGKQSPTDGEAKSGKQSPTDDGETKLTIQVETGSAGDARYVHREVTDINQSPSPDETGDTLYSRKDQQRPFTDKELLSNIQAGTGGSHDSGKAACEPSSKVTDTTESRSQSESQYVLPRASLFSDQTERSPVEKEYESNTQKETSNIEDTGSETTSFVSVLGSQPHGSGDYYHEKKDTFQAERELPHSPVTQHPETHVQRDIEKIQKLKKGHHGSSYSHSPYTRSERLRPQSVHGEYGSNTRPCSVQSECGTSQPMNDPILNDEDINRSERDVIETGEKSLNLQSGAVCLGGDSIESLPKETPKNPVITDPAITDPAVEDEPKLCSRWMALLREISFKSCFMGCLKQYPKAIIFYSLSIFGINSSIALLVSSNWDKDIYWSILCFFIIGIVITHSKRGKFSKYFEKLEKTSCFGLFKCCCKPEPVMERHNQHLHLTNEENTAFIHSPDVSDSHLGSDRQVCKYQNIFDRRSPDDPPQVIREDADVHASPTARRNSELGAINEHHGQASNIEASATESAEDRDEFECEHSGQGLACSCPLNRPERRLDSEFKPEQPSVLPHSVMADDPGTSMNPAGTPSSERRCETRSGVSQSPYKKDPPKSKGKWMEKLLGRPQKSTQTVHAEVPAPETSRHLESTSSGSPHTRNIADIATRPEEFSCEHCGKGVACSCSVPSEKKEK